MFFAYSFYAVIISNIHDIIVYVHAHKIYTEI